MRKHMIILLLFIAVMLGAAGSCGTDTTTPSCSGNYPLNCGSGHCCPTGFGYFDTIGGKCYQTISGCNSASTSCSICSADKGGDVQLIKQ